MCNGFTLLAGCYHDSGMSASHTHSTAILTNMRARMNGCSCHLLAQFHAVWDESPHTEHMLATMGLISLLEDIPQMILLVTSNQERGKWSEAAWFSMVMMSLSISYSLTMRMLFAVHVFRRRAKNLIPNKSLQYQVNAQSIPVRLHVCQNFQCFSLLLIPIRC